MAQGPIQRVLPPAAGDPPRRDPRAAPPPVPAPRARQRAARERRAGGRPAARRRRHHGCGAMGGVLRAGRVVVQTGQLGQVQSLPGGANNGENRCKTRPFGLEFGKAMQGPFWGLPVVSLRSWWKTPGCHLASQLSKFWGRFPTLCSWPLLGMPSKNYDPGTQEELEVEEQAGRGVGRRARSASYCGCTLGSPGGGNSSLTKIRAWLVGLLGFPFWILRMGTLVSWNSCGKMWLTMEAGCQWSSLVPVKNILTRHETWNFKLLFLDFLK